MRARRQILSLAFVASLLGSAAFAAVAALAALAATTSDTTLPGTAVFPESIAVQPGTRTFFVSSFATGNVFRDTPGHRGRLFLPGAGAGRSFAAGVKFDGPGRLMVIGGTSPLLLGQLQIFSSKTGRRQATFTAPPADKANLNDMALARNGDVYITDFATPGIYRVTAKQLKRSSGILTRWLVPPTRIVPRLPANSNFNGIAATADGRSLIVGQTGNGALWRINIAQRTTTPIKIPAGSLAGSDGMLLLGHTLYVAVHGNAVVKLTLNQTYTSARLLNRLTDPSLDLPTAVAVVGTRLLVSNGSKPTGAASYALTSLPAPKR